MLGDRVKGYAAIIGGHTPLVPVMRALCVNPPFGFGGQKSSEWSWQTKSGAFCAGNTLYIQNMYLIYDFIYDLSLNPIRLGGGGQIDPPRPKKIYF